MRPSVSIITIGFNNLAGLRRTVDSVLGQATRPDEYVLIDGGSTDGSREFLSELSDREPIVHAISEPDQGIADAMNKGLAQASGDWICHLHAGDAFADRGVLESVRNRLAQTSAGFIYGACQYVDGTGRAIREWNPPAYSMRRLGIRNFIPHPTVFFRREAMLALNGFRREIPIAMDYDLWLRAANAGIQGEKVDRIIADILDGGISSKRWAMLMDDRAVRLRNLPRGPVGRAVDYGITVLRYVKNRPKERARAGGA